MQSVNSDVQRVAQRLTGLALKRFGFALGIYGPPGIGKTHAVLALLRGAHCRSITVHANQPLEGTLLQLPRPKKLSAWLERSLERLQSGEALTAEALLQTLAGVLSANAPFILHVEDLHESNPERLEFWTQLALTATRLRGVALIVTSRTQPPAPLEAIGLLPLTREASDALLGVEAGAALPPETLEWIFGHAVGNPLFSLEFFRFLARQGTLWNDGHRWRWRTPQRGVMPVTIEALIEQILGEVSSTPVLEAVIRARAVLGIGASQKLWALVAELDSEELELASEELERLGVFSNRDFAHPLYREVALSGVTLEQRRLLARRAIDALQADPESAAQFLDDAELEPSIALELLERAARIAQDAGCELPAARLQAKAVEYATGERRAELAFEAAQLLKRHDKLEATRCATIAVTVKPRDTEAIYLLALLQAEQRHSEEVNRVLERLPLRDRDSIRGLGVQIDCCVMLSDYRGALALWEAHPELQAASPPHVGRRVASAMANLGDTESAFAFASKLLERPDLDGLTRMALVEVCGITRFYESDYIGAEIFFRRTIEISREISLTNRAFAAFYNHGLSLQQLGRYREAVADIEESARIATESSDAMSYASARGLLGEQLFEIGDYNRAEELMLESLGVFEQGRQSENSVDCQGNLSDLYHDWDTPHGGTLSHKHGRAALRYARQLENPRFLIEGLFYGAIAEAAFGNPVYALELAKEGRDLAALRQQEARQTYKAAWAMATAFEALHRRDESLDQWREAYAIASKVGKKLHIHKIGLEIARITHDIGRAREHLAWFEENGLMNGANIARRYFPELATDTVPKSVTHLEPQALTRLEVLGSLQVRFDGAVTPMRGRKRQELLALLLEARISGRGETSRLELMDALYPEADELQSSAGLRDVVYQLRLSLGDGVLTTTANGYALSNIGSDVEEFLKSGETGLWRGMYLQGLTLSGSDTVRESVYLALRTRAEALLETDPAEATRVGRLLCEADPYDLEAVRLTLVGLRLSGNHRSLSRVYEQARTRFLEIGETLPETWQDFVSPVMSG